MSMFAVAVTQNANQGEFGTRTTEYAQDKMEQLLVLAYGDETSDTRVFPAIESGGTGLKVGGSDNPNAPIAGYVDYLDARGNLMPSASGVPANWFYIRAWEIKVVTATLKEVRVTTTVARSIGRTQRPAATLVTLKTFPF
jgi:hypothetical protein